MTHGLPKREISQLLSLFSSFPEISEVILFGSRAMGNFKRGSDVDLALKGKIGTALTTRLSQKLNGETTLPYRFDIIRYNSISNAALKEHVDQFGISLYRAKARRRTAPFSRRAPPRSTVTKGP